MVGDGLDLRAARPSDLAQIEELLASRGEPADAVDLRLVVGDPDEGFDACAVAVDGDRVVSTATLLRETLSIEGVQLPAGQVELVATHPDYEGRGLVRALMGWAHQRSADRGDLVQIMVGIPFFYRQFGYAYAAPMPRVRPVAAQPHGIDTAITIRPAVASDVDAMDALQRAEQAAAEVRMPHSRPCWRWLVARDGSAQWIAERDGRAIGTCRTTPPDEGVIVGELAGEPAAARALIGHAHTLAGGETVTLQERPGAPAFEAIAPMLGVLSGADAQPEWYYGRIPRFSALLEALAPVLLARLDRAGLAAARHEVLLSSWRSHVRFTIGDSHMGPLVEGGPEQRPVSKGGSGVPPDALPALLLGPDGAVGLEERLPDCWLGRQRELMAALFPSVRADLLTFYLPI